MSQLLSDAHKEAIQPAFLTKHQDSSALVHLKHAGGTPLTLQLQKEVGSAENIGGIILKGRSIANKKCGSTRWQMRNQRVKSYLSRT